MASFGLAARFGSRFYTPRVSAPRRNPKALGTDTPTLGHVPSTRRRRLVVAMATKVEKAEVFERTKTISYETTFADLTNDSLDIVEVMMALEEEFEIALDDEESAKITNVEEAVDLIKACVEAK